MSLSDRPKRFYVHVNRDALAKGLDTVWIVQIDGMYFTMRNLEVLVPLSGVYRGPRAKQPKVYFIGEGYGYFIDADTMVLTDEQMELKSFDPSRAQKVPAERS